MKSLTIEIPEWARERGLWVFAGREWLYFITSPIIDAVNEERNGSRLIYVKDGRCSMCGRCCIKRENDKMPFGTKQMEMYGVEESVCDRLGCQSWDFDGERREVYVCMENNAPWGCLGAHPSKRYDECTVSWDVYREKDGEIIGEGEW